MIRHRATPLDATATRQQHDQGDDQQHDADDDAHPADRGENTGRQDLEQQADSDEDNGGDEHD